MSNSDVTIVGAGVAGLTAAIYLGRAGKRVLLLDKSRRVGGRARTSERAGYRFNLGPHALYVRGAGRRVLRELDIPFRGGLATGKGGYACYRDQMHTLPVGLLSLITTGLLGTRDKIAYGRILGEIPRLPTDPLRGSTLRSWVERQTPSKRLRDVLYATFRVASYCNAPDVLDAAAAIEQLRVAISGGVLYLDGGWQSLVDGLRAAAVDAGVRIETGVDVSSLDRLPGDVVVAADPATARALLGGDWSHLVPVRAACLDVALRRLPRPRATFAIGIDEPTYYSVHSAHGRLAPAQGAVIHLARYLAPDDRRTPDENRQQLKAILDRLQPGWRDELEDSRFLPHLTVSHAIPPTTGRPAVAHERGWLAGDWVGDEGMLADTAFASGRRAAAAILGVGESEETLAA